MNCVYDNLGEELRDQALQLKEGKKVCRSNLIKFLLHTAKRIEKLQSNVLKIDAARIKAEKELIYHQNLEKKRNNLPRSNDLYKVTPYQDI